MHLFFTVRMSGSWLTMSFILLYTNEVDGKAIMSTSITSSSGENESTENFIRENRKINSYHHNHNNNQNINYNYDGGKVMIIHDDKQGNRHVTNSYNNHHDNDNLSMRNSVRNRNRKDQSKISSNNIRDHLALTGSRTGRPTPDYSEEDSENQDMLSDVQTPTLRSTELEKIPEAIWTRFLDPNHQRKGSFQYTDFENEPKPEPEPVATPLVQRNRFGSENEHGRRHQKNPSRRNKEKRKDSTSNFLPTNQRRKQHCLKKIMRNIWKLNCKQFINLKRLNLINSNKMDLSNFEIKRRLKKCLALFRIS